MQKPPLSLRGCVSKSFGRLAILFGNYHKHAKTLTASAIKQRAIDEGRGSFSQPKSSVVLVEACERAMDTFFIHGTLQLPRYHACIAAEPGVHGSGITIEIAIKDMISCHPERFPGGRDGIEVRYLGVRMR